MESQKTYFTWEELDVKVCGEELTLIKISLIPETKLDIKKIRVVLKNRMCLSFIFRQTYSQAS